MERKRVGGPSPRDEEQDALRDASSQKGRSRVCTAYAVRVTCGPAREKAEPVERKKKEDSLVFTSSLPRLTRASSYAQSERLAGRGS